MTSVCQQSPKIYRALISIGLLFAWAFLFRFECVYGHACVYASTKSDSKFDATKNFINFALMLCTVTCNKRCTSTYNLLPLNMSSNRIIPSDNGHCAQTTVSTVCIQHWTSKAFCNDFRTKFAFVVAQADVLFVCNWWKSHESFQKTNSVKLKAQERAKDRQMCRQ